MRSFYSILLKASLLILLIPAIAPVMAQQQMVIQHYLFFPELYNPARFGAQELHRVMLTHQQRKLGFDVPNYSTLFTYNSRPLSFKRTMGAGAIISNDREFTMNRLNAMAYFSYHILNDVYLGVDSVSAVKRLSIGAGAGLVNISSNLSDVQYYDPGDAIIFRQPNYNKLNAAIGLDFYFANKIVAMNLGAAVTQLPSLFDPDTNGEDVRSIKLVPHMMGNLSLMFTLPKNIGFGPFAHYRALFLADEKLGPSRVDVGLKTEFRKKNFWFAGAYRFGGEGSVAASGAIGARLLSRIDTTAIRDTVGDVANKVNELAGAKVPLGKKKKKKKERHRIIHTLDLSLMFEYPLNDMAVFGPQLELGLNWNFGLPVKIPDTIVVYRDEPLPPFWYNDSRLTTWGDMNLKNPPEGFRSTSDRSQRNAVLHFVYEDDYINYYVEDMEEISELANFLGKQIVSEGLDPQVKLRSDNPYRKQKVDSLEYIAFKTFLRFDSVSAKQETSIRYEGEYGETLSERIFYDGEPITIRVSAGEFVTNLELAMLKMVSFRDKLRDVVSEVLMDPERVGIPDLYSMDIKIQIFSENLYLDTFQQNHLFVNFHRKPLEKPDGKK